MTSTLNFELQGVYSTVAQKSHPCKLKLLQQIKILLQNKKNITWHLNVENNDNEADIYQEGYHYVMNHQGLQLPSSIEKAFNLFQQLKSLCKILNTCMKWKLYSSL